MQNRNVIDPTDTAILLPRTTMKKQEVMQIQEIYIYCKNIYVHQSYFSWVC